MLLPLCVLNVDDGYGGHIDDFGDVIAALQLGDLHFLAQNMEWARGLIKNYGIPDESLDRYINSYIQAIHNVIGTDGEVVVDYFENLEATTV